MVGILTQNRRVLIFNTGTILPFSKCKTKRLKEKIGPENLARSTKEKREIRL